MLIVGGVIDPTLGDDVAVGFHRHAVERAGGAPVFPAVAEPGVDRSIGIEPDKGAVITDFTGGYDFVIRLQRDATGGVRDRTAIGGKSTEAGPGIRGTEGRVRRPIGIEATHEGGTACN